MKIAIVGTGISGLVSAYYLSRNHEVTVFESGSHVGGHTHTVAVEEDGQTRHVDTGFIVFNRKNYPAFNRILEELGVRSQPSDMSFSVSAENGRFEYNGTSLNRLFAQRTNLFRPGFYGMIRDIMRFGQDARKFLESDETDSCSVADFLERHHYGSLFTSKYLGPLGAALWSCPSENFMQFPMRFVGEFLANHFMLQVGGRPKWRGIEGGSFRYVEKMTRGFADRIRLNCGVESIRRDASGVLISHREGTDRFDHVVVACHADQAMRLLSDPSPCETETLSCFPYQKNRVFLHTDSSVLPKRKLAWAAWNAKILDESAKRETSGGIAVSYNMNILQSLPGRTVYCVTLNEEQIIDPSKIIRKIDYHHPLFTVSRAEAREKQNQLIDRNQTSFCGAYWGFGFHEDGVQSALRVVEQLLPARKRELA